MSCKRLTILGCATLSLSVLGTVTARAQEAANEPEGGAVQETDPALKAEIAYVEALIDARLPDFAEDVIAATKKKWPESEVMFFAIEIRGMLSLGKYDEAEAKIAALPDRKSAKYWAARLELANNYFARGRKDDCTKIYEDFFKNNAKPDKSLVDFTRQARYQWGQILLAAGRRAEAAKTFDQLLAMLNPKTSEDDDNTWCNVACETTELYLSLASEQDAKKRGDYLNPAKKYVDKLLWRQDKPLYFGRAIAMKAYYELLSGRIDKAQSVINDYKDQLQEIHDQIVAVDPTGREGLLRQSPMPQCRYLMAEKYWAEAKDEFKKPKRDDEKIKTLLFGGKKSNGKRDGQGAFNNAVNVYLRFPQSVWAPAAGRLQDEIAAFAQKEYGAKIKTHATPEQMRHVMEAQFQTANEKFGEGDWEGAIKDYFVALQNYPEEELSVAAIENIASAYLNLIRGSQDAAKKEDWRIDADAVEGYLAERFGGNKNKKLMLEAGNAALRLANREKDAGETARATRLYKSFLSSYTRHTEAAGLAGSLAGDLQKKAFAITVAPVAPEDDDETREQKEKLIAERDAILHEALDYYALIIKHFTQSPYYLTSIAFSSSCYEKMGDLANAIDYMKRYADAIDGSKAALRKMQAQMSLAVLYQKHGLAILAKVDADPEAEDAEQLARTGSAQIVRGIKEFQSFAAEAKKKIESGNVLASEKPKYEQLREGALYLAGDCWNRLTRPADRLSQYRERAAANLEAYVAEYPKGRHAKSSYVKLGRLYSQLDNIEKGKDALTRLKAEFPESEEAKKAMPQLATSLVAFAATMEEGEAKEKMLKEVREIYREMLESTKNEYKPMDYVRAGEVLVDAQSWSLAADAFAKAEVTAGTNQPAIVARARLGKAKSLLAQKMYFDAREALDEFMDDASMSRTMAVTNAYEMMITVATRQGETERDAAKRTQHFNAAITAINRLRNAWSVTNALGQTRMPRWQIDRLDLRASDVSMARMDAETAQGNEDGFAKACSKASQQLETFVKTRHPTAEHPIEKIGAKDLENLEKAYGDIVQVLARMGTAHVDEVVVYGRAYETYFPKGKRLAAVRAAMKEAIAKGAKEPGENPPDETAVEATPEQPAEEAGEPAEEAAAEASAESEVSEAEEAAPAAESEASEEAAPAEESAEETPAPAAEGDAD